MCRVYLDYNASTPIAPEVVEAMSGSLKANFGNPSSSHWAGKPARAAPGRHPAQPLAEQKRDHCPRAEDQQRGRHHRQQEGEGRLGQVSREQPAQPAEILLPERQVESELMAERGLLFHAQSQHRTHGVAGEDDMDGEE